jgi:UDP-N-acetylglucosamine--dolichyl-phosphate N-acetylglucosaminephosphotransferase
MMSFAELGLSWIDIAIISAVGIGVFLITFLIYPPLIKLLKAKKWVGYDIHKKYRPETAESGGIGLTIGIIAGIIAILFLYPGLFNEAIVFLITVILAAIVGLIDDQVQLSSIKKIILMILTGAPIFFLNLLGYITVDSPTLPIIGHLRLTIIYPLILPLIIAVTTNTTNMLEGYNGEGSGTCSIAVGFMIICALIAQSAEGLIFGIPILAAILAFFMFNKYPAKVFPGDIGTLVIGASIGLLGILGSIEVSMFLVLLAHVFNSFYVLASLRGFRESHDIKKKDIWQDENDLIHASDEDGAAMSLPRLLVAKGSMSEPELVKHFLILSFISGLYAIFGEVVRQWTINNEHIGLIPSVLILGTCIILYLVAIRKYPKVIGLTYIMMLLLLTGAGALYIINGFVVDTILNWLYSFILAGIVLGGWYYISVRYFWTMIDKMKKQPGYISTVEHEKLVKQKKETQ